MENKNYYPLRLREFSSNKSLNGIITKVEDQEITVAELVDSDLAQQLVDAYNEKYYIPETLRVKERRYLNLQEHETYGLNGADYFFRKDGAWFIHLNLKGVYKEERKDNGEHIFVLVKDQGKYEFKNPIVKTGISLTVPPIKNELFTVEPLEHDIAEFMKTGIDKPFTIDEQIKWLDSFTNTSYIKENLLAIKRWSQNPLWTQLDVEKVIEDLLQLIKEYTPHRGPEYAYQSEIQNAEAALGMLQAFKEKRDKHANIPTGAKKYPLTDDQVFGKTCIDEAKKDIECKRIVLAITKDTSFNFAEAHAIIYAIEQMDKLKSNIS